MSRSAAIVTAIGIAISAAGYAVQHPAAPALRTFAQLPRPILGRPKSLYPQPTSADIAHAIAASGEDQQALAAIYAASGTHPLWDASRLGDLQTIVDAAMAQGVDASAFPAPRTLLTTGPHPPSTMADADVAVTRALLHLARATRNGILPTQALGTDWTIAPPVVDVTPALVTAFTSRTLKPALEALAPQDPQYGALSKALTAYRDIERRGGWKALTKADDTALRDRLEAEGYAAHTSLPRAVAFFQGTHNLEPTGQVDAATLAALNVPVDVRIAQIAINLERWRHLPHDFGRAYVLVDAADARMTLFEDGEPTLSMRTVLGDRQHATPVLAAAITAVTFNPHWDIPVSIATREVLPMLKKDPMYLAKNDIVISDGPAKGSAGAYIDWQQFSQRAFPMHLRQRSGPGNALGAIKFEMPNSEDIYLHDTPARWVFNEPDRRFSHGCVRLEYPEQLALRLLPPHEWSEKAINGAIASGATRTVALEKPVPVYILYATVIAGEDGGVIFRDDPYGRDPALATALGLHLSAQGGREQTKARLPLAP